MSTFPGLNMQSDKYPMVMIDGEAFREIPFSDWIPSDFEDVNCSRGGGLKKMYFSPSTGMMVPSESENASEAVEPSELKIWLKKV